MGKRVALVLIKVYQKYISPLFPRCCRFEPSCSRYAMEAIEHFGLFRGAGKALLRLLKCHPFHQGGYDPVN